MQSATMATSEGLTFRRTIEPSGVRRRLSLALPLARVRSSYLLGARSWHKLLPRSSVLEVQHLFDQELAAFRCRRRLKRTHHCDNQPIVVSGTRTSKFLRQPVWSTKRQIRPTLRAAEREPVTRASHIFKKNTVSVHAYATTYSNALTVGLGVNARKCANALNYSSFELSRLRLGRCRLRASDEKRKHQHGGGGVNVHGA